MKNPSYTYENVQIGNFLIAMGYSLRDKSIPLSGTINLFQQTPDDTEMGDVFGGFNGRYFILEFKRDGNHLSTELDKEARVKLVQKIGLGNDELFKVSFASHLMLYPSWTDSNQLNYFIQPYLKALKAPATNGRENPFKAIHTSRKFIDELYDLDSNLGCDISKIEEYINLLKSCNEVLEGSASNGGRRATSGLMIYADPEQGEIRSYKFESLHDLHLEIQRTQAVTQQQRIEIERKIRKKREIDKEKRKDMGFDMGM